MGLRQKESMMQLRRSWHKLSVKGIHKKEELSVYLYLADRQGDLNCFYRVLDNFVGEISAEQDSVFKFTMN